MSNTDTYFIDWKNYERDDDRTIVENDKDTHSEAGFRTLKKRNRTRLDIDNLPKDEKRRWNRLKKHQLDAYGGYRADIEMASKANFEIKKEVMLVLGSQLEMTVRLTYQAIHKLLQIDIPKTGYPMPVIGFCVFVHLYDQETSEYEEKTQQLHNEKCPGRDRIYYPTRDGEYNDKHFQRIAKEFINFYPNVESGGIQRILTKIENDRLPSKKPSEEAPMRQEIMNEAKQFSA